MNDKQSFLIIEDTGYTNKKNTKKFLSTNWQQKGADSIAWQHLSIFELAQCETGANSSFSSVRKGWSPVRVGGKEVKRVNRLVAAIRDISRSRLDPNDFTVLNCIVKGHASLSPPSLRLRLCSRFTLLAT
ncbi:hypothetical protein TNCV_4656871 [Trichonephila clavipes]|nr:hypothetical protein TNCV_4656871 [Trichonephila clavipes]